MAFLIMSFFIAIADKGMLMGQTIANLVVLWFGYGTAKFILRLKNRWLKMELEESTTDESINIKMTQFRDFQKESGGFGENLDKINFWFTMQLT